MQICKYKETPTFHFHNANPKGKNANDCVARAICVALGQSWEDTIREMTELGIKRGYAFNEDKLIDIYLKEKGWTKMSEPRDHENKKIKVGQFVCRRGNDKGVIIAKAGSHHVTLIVNGVVWDTWNCCSQTMHSYFVNSKAVAPELKREEPKPEKRRFTL